MKRYGSEAPLDFHGDSELSEGVVDLAVNVRTAPMPAWLADPIAGTLSHLSAYPDQRPALEAVAARHRRTSDEVLLTAGAAQAFTLIARAFRPRRAVVVHPQFTEPEAALLAAGHEVTRHVLSEDNGFRLEPDGVPDDADLIVVGNPTNPTSVLHPAETIARLARPGRTLVVDEAFADTIAGEPESLASRRGVDGLVVIRSLTKTWGLAGLRIGYVLAAPDVVAALGVHQPLWPVATPALAAAVACSSPGAVEVEREIAAEVAADRDHMLAALSKIDGVRVAGSPASSFVLVRVTDGERVRSRLRDAGFAVRRGSTFPGLGPDWLRIAVRTPSVIDPFVEALASVLKDPSGEMRE
jgi:histidinol-phosphate aminotransferase